MSLASDWAAAMAVEAQQERDAEALRPPSWTDGVVSATVAVDGKLYIDKGSYLAPADALALGQWIVATFG